ncbi:SNF2 protein [Ordospora pajunii]|uniref:SNF2 protein n=1 Tax=Ordospora pajunii TaxID=3039483 RepID=UPI0029527F9A|nr:SNF2 protein [Ordospora pajunii]KAH9411701.1 SNF2 protein [Ordospora pajunii]
MDYSADEYEKTLVEKYLEKAASSRIDEIEEKVKRYKESGDFEKTSACEEEIKQIRRSLAAEKQVISGIESRQESLEAKEVFDFEWKGCSDDSDVKSFEEKCRHAVEVFCRKHGLSSNAFEEYVQKHSEEHEGFAVPNFLWESLFAYQQEGVKWMLNLYKTRKGGILADDMGLGKTFQVIVFLTALFRNGAARKALIVCPATIALQWVSEWKKFYPFLRVFTGRMSSEKSGVCVMSYEKFKMTAGNEEWDVLVLDEGHRIKNKNAQVSLAAKKVKSGCRLILSGTPIQNNLSELWSMFDFVNPGLLGSHSAFNEEFEEVISKGGYRNASNSQVERAYKHSLMLRSLIEPYILRRTKAQVSHRLPSKQDKIVFCSLTPLQTDLYRKVLGSKHIMNVLTGKANLLSGITLLRKVCNHPQLLFASGSAGHHGMHEKRQGELKVENAEFDYGYEEETLGISVCNGEVGGCELVESACKMKILVDFLKKWKKSGDKVLIFSQTIRMLDIIERCIAGYAYMRMDGTTSTPDRRNLVERFNSDESIFIFLLTTRVGGLGLNLTGASRVVIYDPDWNPSTDTQAKERAWRYGQKKGVEIYRLVCKDTIEEKVYQKQIFKDMLGKKVLSDPRLSRFFNKSCVDDLFSFDGTDELIEIKMHEEHGEEYEPEGVLKGVREKDGELFLRMKFLNSKNVLSGREMLEYIRLREESMR